jgi:hypothetical protein
MKPFVGFSEKDLSVNKLLEIIESLSSPSSYYFLRWTDRVSGIIKKKLTDAQFPMLEGQMFNHDCELRWKYKSKNNYEALLLSTNGEHPSFTALGENWLIEEHNAHIYPATETRFPKGFQTTNVDVAQRYFKDKKTATVHFVALTTKR